MALLETTVGVAKIHYGTLGAWLGSYKIKRTLKGLVDLAAAMATPYPSGSAMPVSAPPGPVDPCSRVELSISCSDLLDKDFFSKSDPIVAVYLRSQGSQTYSEVSNQ